MRARVYCVLLRNRHLFMETFTEKGVLETLCRCSMIRPAEIFGGHVIGLGEFFFTREAS